MSFTKLGVVLPLGAGGSIDDVGTWAPSPIIRDGRVWLYYRALSGTSSRIALAVSDDGLHFTKLGVVIPLGAGGDIDDVNAHTPTAIIRDGRVFLYYVAYDGAVNRVALAVSGDGVHFTKLGAVLPLGAGGSIDDGFTTMAGAMVRDGRVFLYYTASDGTSNRIALAVSDDGVHFTKLGVVLPLGESGSGDDTQQYRPSPVMIDGRVFLYYVGNDAVSERVNLAVSDDGVHFTKLGVVIPRGVGASIDDAATQWTGVIIRDGRVFLYYTANDAAKRRVALAVSDTGY